MPRIDVALVYLDGRKEVVTVGRPADLIAFADKFEKVAPSEPYAVFELTWLAHRALKVEQPLDEWVDSLEDITSADDEVEKVRAELEGPDPTPAAAEAATPIRAAADEAPATERGIESHG